MRIRDLYQKLAKLNPSMDLIEDVKTLKNQCLIEQNNEYFYLASLLLIDIYIQYEMMDEALALLNKDFVDFDATTFQNIYVSFLERIIYVYIQKRNYLVAQHYVFEKRKYIDSKNRDVINRWYLEMAYIFAETNQQSKALTHLQAIVENFPSEEILSHTLSNMTKLYIDQNLIKEAKQTLNECLQVTFDLEGLQYCDYLLAKICVLEKKYHEAMVLYRGLFQTQIQKEFLGIANDYLQLLITMNDTSGAEEFLKRMEPLVENNSDLEIKKEFYINKVRYLFAKNHIQDDNLTMKIIDLDKEMRFQENKILTENLEDYRLDEKNRDVKKWSERVERTVQMIQTAFTAPTLRDLFFQFAKRLELVVPFTDLTFVLLEPISLTKKIPIYYYKVQRLYEKEMTIDELKETIVELMLINSKEVSLDLEDSKLILQDVFTKKNIKELDSRFLYGIPCQIGDNWTMAAVFSSSNQEMLESENLLICKIAIKLLELKVKNLLLEEEKSEQTFIQDKILVDNNIYIGEWNQEQIILSKKLQQLLQEETSILPWERFIHLFGEKEHRYWKDLLIDKQKSKLSFPWFFQNENHFITVQTFSYLEEKIFFTITFSEEEKYTFFDDERLNEKLNQYKQKVNDLEFKFSLIRLYPQNDNFSKLKKQFQDYIYFLSDKTAVIIIENEVSQRILDKLVKEIAQPLAIIRFPRDLIQIDEVVSFSKISLDHGETFFTEEFYQKNLKMNSVRNLVQISLKEPLELWRRKLLGFTDDFYEIRCKIKGVAASENSRDFLEDILLENYDQKMLDKVLTLSFETPHILCLNTKTVFQAIEKGKLIKNGNVIICLDQYQDHYEEINRFFEKNEMPLIIHFRLLLQMNPLLLNQITYMGILIDEGITLDERQTIIQIAKQKDLVLITNYAYPDYEKCLYRSDQMEEIKNER